MAVQPGDLKIASLLPDVGVGERAGGMCLLQSALVHVVVEDHGDAKAADLDRSVRVIRKGETQSELAVDDAPCANYL